MAQKKGCVAQVALSESAITIMQCKSSIVISRLYVEIVLLLNWGACLFKTLFFYFFNDIFSERTNKRKVLFPNLLMTFCNELFMEILITLKLLFSSRNLKRTFIAVYIRIIWVFQSNKKETILFELLVYLITCPWIIWLGNVGPNRSRNVQFKQSSRVVQLSRQSRCLSLSVQLSKQNIATGNKHKTKSFRPHTRRRPNTWKNPYGFSAVGLRRAGGGRNVKEKSCEFLSRRHKFYS